MAALASFLMMPAAVAQTPKHSASLAYGVSVPVGGGGFMENAGFANVSAEYACRLAPMFTAGVSVGYGYGRQKKNTDDRYDGDYVSGFSDRKLSILPAMAQLGFFPLEQQGRMQPYLIFGAGVQYAEFDIKGDQIDSRRTSDLAFLYAPQIGLRFLPSLSGKMYLDARFSLHCAGNKWDVMNVGSLRSVMISLGGGISF